MKNYWKRFSFFDKGLAVFFMLNLFLDVINKKILQSVIPGDLISYLFWLSTGLYLGFQLCKYEYKQVIKKQEKESNVPKNARP